MHRSWADNWGYDWPKQIAYTVDGLAVTYLELLNKKREKQRRRLEFLRTPSVRIEPCFIWVFYNKQSFPFGGWWIYIRTLKNYFPIDFRGQNTDFKSKIMALYPCGFLPLIENFRFWAEEFANVYHRPSAKREKQGLVKAKVKIKDGRLNEIIKLT